MAGLSILEAKFGTGKRKAPRDGIESLLRRVRRRLKCLRTALAVADMNRRLNG
jgi:hypothetical protein